jgi:16S rRNA (uracil1498-N3)-methyltransferase
MQLFYNENIEEQTQNCTLDKEERNHVVKVLRKKIGDKIHFTNGKGIRAKGIIEQIDPKSVRIRIENTQKMPKPSYELHIAIAPTKNNDRYEWFLEKATEMGLTEVTPIICDQSERKVIKQNRLERVVLSAVKQSLEDWKPKVNPAISLDDFLEQNRSEDLYIAHCESNMERIEFSNTVVVGSKITILIGPEGDFSKSEINKALLKGYKAVSLGNKRLRTETAGVYVAAATAIKNLSL